MSRLVTPRGRPPTRAAARSGLRRRLFGTYARSPGPPAKRTAHETLRDILATGQKQGPQQGLLFFFWTRDDKDTGEGVLEDAGDGEGTDRAGRPGPAAAPRLGRLGRGRLAGARRVAGGGSPEWRRYRSGSADAVVPGAGETTREPTARLGDCLSSAGETLKILTTSGRPTKTRPC